MEKYSAKQKHLSYPEDSAQVLLFCLYELQEHNDVALPLSYLSELRTGLEPVTHGLTKLVSSSDESTGQTPVLESNQLLLTFKASYQA